MANNLPGMDKREPNPGIARHHREAAELYERSASNHRLAAEAYDIGDLESAQRLADEAARLHREGVKSEEEAERQRR